MKNANDAGKVDAAPPQPLETTAQQRKVEARRVTTEMCRAVLQQPNLTDEEAEKIVEHLYLFADVVTDAFIEHWQGTRGTEEALAELDNRANLSRCFLPLDEDCGMRSILSVCVPQYPSAGMPT